MVVGSEFVPSVSSLSHVYILYLVDEFIIASFDGGGWYWFWICSMVSTSRLPIPIPPMNPSVVKEEHPLILIISHNMDLNGCMHHPKLPPESGREVFPTVTCHVDVDADVDKFVVGVDRHLCVYPLQKRITLYKIV